MKISDFDNDFRLFCWAQQRIVNFTEFEKTLSSAYEKAMWFHESHKALSREGFRDFTESFPELFKIKWGKENNQARRLLTARLELLSAMNEELEVFCSQKAVGDRSPHKGTLQLLLENRVDKVLHSLYESEDIEKTLSQIKRDACVYAARLWMSTRMADPTSLPIPGWYVEDNVLLAKSRLVMAFLKLFPKFHQLSDVYINYCKYRGGDDWDWNRPMWVCFNTPATSLKFRRFALSRNCIPKELDDSPRCARYLKRLEDLNFEALRRYLKSDRKDAIKREFIIRLLRETERAWNWCAKNSRNFDYRFFYKCLEILSEGYWRRFGEEWSLVRDTSSGFVTEPDTPWGPPSMSTGPQASFRNPLIQVLVFGEKVSVDPWWDTRWMTREENESLALNQAKMEWEIKNNMLDPIL